MSNVKQTLFEQLGYTKDEPRPTYKTYGLLKVKGNMWTVIEASFRGGYTLEIRHLCEPTTKMFAIETYKVALARYIAGQFNE
jgi:hypothetical protein